MKYLRLVLCLTVIAFVVNASAAFAESYDSDYATIKKSTDSTAKVTIGEKTTYTAPVTFEDGASWDSVKDHYEIDSTVQDLLAKKKIAISIGSDGKASFHVVAHHKKK